MNSHFHLFSDRIQRIEFNIASKHCSDPYQLTFSIQRIEFNIASKRLNGGSRRLKVYNVLNLT